MTSFLGGVIACAVLQLGLWALVPRVPLWRRTTFAVLAILTIMIIVAVRP